MQGSAVLHGSLVGHEAVACVWPQAPVTAGLWSFDEVAAGQRLPLCAPSACASHMRYAINRYAPPPVACCRQQAAYILMHSSEPCVPGYQPSALRQGLGGMRLRQLCCTRPGWGVCSLGAAGGRAAAPPDPERAPGARAGGAGAPAGPEPDPEQGARAAPAGARAAVDLALAAGERAARFFRLCPPDAEAAAAGARPDAQAGASLAASRRGCAQQGSQDGVPACPPAWTHAVTCHCVPHTSVPMLFEATGSCARDRRAASFGRQ